MDDDHTFPDEDFPEVEVVDEPAAEGGLPHHLTREELDVVGSSVLFEAVFGKGYVRWSLILGFTGVTAALLIAGFWASAISVSETLVLYKQDSWVPGEPNAFRLAYIDDTEGFIPLKRAHVILHRGAPMEEAILFSGSLDPGQAASIVVNPPRWSGGDYGMTIRAETLDHKKSAALNVNLDPGYGGSIYSTAITSETLRNFPGGFSYYDPALDIRIELLPESYVLASSLHNLVYVRTTDGSGRPVSTLVGLKLASGFVQGDIPSELQTDCAGLASFIVYPAFNVMAFSVSAADASGNRGCWGVISLPVEPRIFRVRAGNPHVAAGGTIDLRVYTISRSSPIYLDIYQGGIWSYAISGFLNSFSTQVSIKAPQRPGLITVQAYGDPCYVGKAVGSIHLWVQKEGETLEQSIRSVAELLAAEQIDTSYAAATAREGFPPDAINAGQLMAFLLSRLDKGFYEPKVFYTTRAEDENNIGRLKDKIKRIVVLSLSCAGGIFALAVVLAVLIAFRRQPPAVAEFQRSPDMGMEEIIDWKGKKVLVEQSPSLKELEGRRSLLHTGWGKDSGMGTRRFFIQLALLAAVTAALFGLLAVLITYMRWTFTM